MSVYRCLRMLYGLVSTHCRWQLEMFFCHFLPPRNNMSGWAWTLDREMMRSAFYHCAVCRSITFFVSFQIWNFRPSSTTSTPASRTSATWPKFWRNSSVMVSQNIFCCSECKNQRVIMKGLDKEWYLKAQTKGDTLMSKQGTRLKDYWTKLFSVCKSSIRGEDTEWQK